MFFKNIKKHILFIVYFINSSYILILTNEFSYENLTKGLVGVNRPGLYINQTFCFLKFTKSTEVTIVSVIFLCFFLAVTASYSVVANSYEIEECFFIFNAKIKIKTEYISFFLFLILNFM